MRLRRKDDFTAATDSAGCVGVVLVQRLMDAGVGLLLFAGAWLALIGWFVKVAAAGEKRFAALREAFAGLRIGDKMVPDPAALPADIRRARFEAWMFAGARHPVYPVVDDTGVVGVLPLRSFGSMPASKGRHLRFVHRTVPLGDTVVLDLADAAMRLGQTHLGPALVLGDGALVGLPSVNDLAALLELRASGDGALGSRKLVSHRPVRAGS